MAQPRPLPCRDAKTSRRRRQHKATDDDIDLSKPAELVALSVKERTARCRLLGSERIITLRASRLWEVVPGAIVSVNPGKQWRYSGHPYLSGEVQSIRIDVKALDLVPLGLEDMGMWDPKEEYWGEEGEFIEEWAKPIIAHGPCRFRPPGNGLLFDKSMNYEGLRLDSRMENGYEEGCTWGAKNQKGLFPFGIKAFSFWYFIIF